MLTTQRLIEAITANPAATSASLPLRIENATGKRASIYLLTAISQWTPSNARDVQAALKGITAPAIDLYINSPGGSVFEGLAIHNLIKAHPAKVTAHVIGLAASIASVIAMAGDEIVMADGAMMMIHSPSLATGGNAAALRRDAALLDQVEQSLIDVYAGRTKTPRAAIKAMLDKETWFGAADAVKAKLADRVSAPVAMAAQWKASDFPALPAAAKAHAAADTSHRAMSAELDRLRSENAELRAKVEKEAEETPTSRALKNWSHK